MTQEAPQLAQVPPKRFRRTFFDGCFNLREAANPFVEAVFLHSDLGVICRPFHWFSTEFQTSVGLICVSRIETIGNSAQDFGGIFQVPSDRTRFPITQGLRGVKDISSLHDPFSVVLSW